MTEYRTTTTGVKLGVVTCAGKRGQVFTWCIDPRDLDEEFRRTSETSCPHCGACGVGYGLYRIIDDASRSYTKKQFLAIVDACDYRVWPDGTVLEGDEV